MSPIERHVALVQANDVAGVIYLDSDSMLNTISIITTPVVHNNRTEWVIDQQGNNLTNCPEGIKLNALELYGLVLVSMQEALANNLGLKWDTLTTKNCTLWTGGDIDTDFPGIGKLCIVDFFCAFPSGYGSMFPEGSLDHPLIAIASETGTTSICCGIPLDGVSVALPALSKIKFNSF